MPKFGAMLPGTMMIKLIWGAGGRISVWSSLQWDWYSRSWWQQVHHWAVAKTLDWNTYIEMKSVFPCIFSTEFALCIPTVCIAGAITVARRGLKCSSPGENKHVLPTLPGANLWGEGPSRYGSQSVPKLSRSFRRFSVTTWKSLIICFRSLQIAVWFPWRVERTNVANAWKCAK